MEMPLNAKIQYRWTKIWRYHAHFLNNRNKDIELITKSLSTGDLAALKVRPLSQGGNAGDTARRLGIIGREMETSAKQKYGTGSKLFQKMKDYLANLDIEFI